MQPTEPVVVTQQCGHRRGRSGGPLRVAVGDRAGLRRRPPDHRRRRGPQSDSRAVERTVPFGLICFSVVTVRYALHGHTPDDVTGHRARARWYITKTEPSYDDMTINLRRVIIAARFRTPCLSRPPRKKPGPSSPPGQPRRDLINKICETRGMGEEYPGTAAVVMEEDHGDGPPHDRDPPTPVRWVGWRRSATCRGRRSRRRRFRAWSRRSARRSRRRSWGCRRARRSCWRPCSRPAAGRSRRPGAGPAADLGAQGGQVAGIRRPDPVHELRSFGPADRGRRFGHVARRGARVRGWATNRDTWVRQRARLTVPPMFGQCFRSRSNDSNRPKATA